MQSTQRDSVAAFGFHCSDLWLKASVTLYLLPILESFNDITLLFYAVFDRQMKFGLKHIFSFLLFALDGNDCTLFYLNDEKEKFIVTKERVKKKLEVPNIRKPISIFYA